MTSSQLWILGCDSVSSHPFTKTSNEPVSQVGRQTQRALSQLWKPVCLLSCRSERRMATAATTIAAVPAGSRSSCNLFCAHFQQVHILPVTTDKRIFSSFPSLSCRHSASDQHHHHHYHYVHYYSCCCCRRTASGCCFAFLDPPAKQAHWSTKHADDYAGDDRFKPRHCQMIT